MGLQFLQLALLSGILLVFGMIYARLGEIVPGVKELVNEWIEQGHMTPEDRLKILQAKVTPPGTGARACAKKTAPFRKTGSGS